MSDDEFEPPGDVDYLKQVYDDQVRRGHARGSAPPHQYRTAHCVHDRHDTCTPKCTYCRAMCDCPCHSYAFRGTGYDR